MCGEFDLRTHDPLADILMCLRDQDCSRIYLDASGLTFVDASCMRVLHNEGDRLRARGGALQVTAGSPTFVRLARAAGYPDLSPVDGDQALSTRHGRGRVGRGPVGSRS